MKTVALFLLFFSVISVAQSTGRDHSITVHVTSSELSWLPGAIGAQQSLTVIIEGKKYQLLGRSLGGLALLNLGDYKAKPRISAGLLLI